MALSKKGIKVLSIFVITVAILLGWVGSTQEESSFLIACCLHFGAICSALAGFIGMRVATKAARDNAAGPDWDTPWRSLLPGVASWAWCGRPGGWDWVLYSWSSLLWVGTWSAKVVTVITGFSFGASSIARFARVGGGILPKQPDVGADLVSKVNRNSKFTFESGNHCG